MLCIISAWKINTIGGIDESTEVYVQGSLFESLGRAAADPFDEKDKYKLFARKIWPLLASVAKNWQNVMSLATGDLESNR